MKVIAAYSKPEDAYLAASFLESNGIATSVRDAHTVNMNWLYSDAIGGVKLEVADDDVDQARELLELGKEKTGGLSCPNCGSQNLSVRNLTVFAGFCLAVGFLRPIHGKTVDCAACKTAFPLKSARPQCG